jgi:hypothetical protein
LKFFRDEYLEHIDRGRCPFDHAASYLFEPTARCSPLRPDSSAAGTRDEEAAA